MCFSIQICLHYTAEASPLWLSSTGTTSYPVGTAESPLLGEDQWVTGIFTLPGHHAAVTCWSRETPHSSCAQNSTKALTYLHVEAVIWDRLFSFEILSIKLSQANHWMPTFTERIRKPAPNKYSCLWQSNWHSRSLTTLENKALYLSSLNTALGLDC